jgi:hypothetical protein
MKLTKNQLRKIIEKEIKSISEGRQTSRMIPPPGQLDGLDHAKEIAKNLRLAVEYEKIDPIQHKKVLLKLIDLVLELD